MSIFKEEDIRILNLLKDSYTEAEIAEELEISILEIQTKLIQIRKKLDSPKELRLTGMVVEAIKQGIIEV